MGYHDKVFGPIPLFLLQPSSQFLLQRQLSRCSCFRLISLAPAGICGCPIPEVACCPICRHLRHPAQWPWPHVACVWMIPSRCHASAIPQFLIIIRCIVFSHFLWPVPITIAFRVTSMIKPPNISFCSHRAKPTVCPQALRRRHSPHPGGPHVTSDVQGPVVCPAFLSWLACSISMDGSLQ